MHRRFHKRRWTLTCFLAAMVILPTAAVINGRGFEVLVHSAEEAKAFLSEYAQTGGQDQAFFSKWMHFDTYRKVVFPQQ